MAERKERGVSEIIDGAGNTEARTFFFIFRRRDHGWSQAGCVVAASAHAAGAPLPSGRGPALPLALLRSAGQRPHMDGQ